MKLDDLHYNLPGTLVALNPKKPRDKSSLLINSSKKKIIMFKDIVSELNENDALVFNDTKVINADFEGLCEGKKISINLNKLENKKKKYLECLYKDKQETYWR